MKLRLLMVVASAVLLFAPRPVSALDTDGQQGAATSGRALMQQQANESAQATTDIPLGGTAQEQAVRNVSYGGVAMGQSEAGNRQTSCGAAPQCKVYFGQ